MTKFENIKVITFDADGTLWDFMKVMRYSLQKVLDALVEIDPSFAEKLNIDKMIDIRNKVANDLKGIITNLEEIRLRAFMETLTVINKPNEELAKFLNDIYYKHRFDNIKLYDDVLPTLQSLKGKYILGILSNGNSYPEKCGLDNIFDFVIFAQDYGIEKPDPGLFKVALDISGSKPSQMIHIGDSIKDDIHGAQNAGVIGIWINRINEISKEEIKYEIKSLAEILDMIKE
ncbi:MAG: HAD family hydrolase [Asgard group archaeon]|nr:HAD family hydrolase [Asgard group archaeon]